jgi:hypothetical protein
MSFPLFNATVVFWFLSFQSLLASRLLPFVKDLSYLASKGLVQRTHGGALTPQGATTLDPSLKKSSINSKKSSS